MVAQSKTRQHCSNNQQLQNNNNNIINHFDYNYIENGQSRSLRLEPKDIQCLDPKTYLNDTIINFFLKFIEKDLLHFHKRP